LNIGNTTEGRRVAGVSLAVIQLTVLAFHGPAMWVARNSPSYPDLGEAALVSLAALAGAGVLFLALRMVGITALRSLAVVSAGLLVYWNWRSLALPILGAPAWLSAAVLASLLIWGAYLQADKRLFRVAIFSVGVTLCGVSMIVFAFRTLPVDTSNLALDGSIQASAQTARRPNIYMLILDGYPRGDVLREQFGFDNQPFMDELTTSGFDVAPNATSNYSLTQFSLASVLAMSYLMETDTAVTRADLDVVRATLAGENASARFLAEQGYEHIQGSEAWWGTECSPQMDICLPNPLLGRTAYELMAATPLEPWIYHEYGDVGTALALERYEQIKTSPEFQQGFGEQDPDFVFLHMPLPHPPLYLDSECAPRLHPYAEGRILNQYPSVLPEILAWRQAAFVEQVECANLVTRALIEAVPDDGVIVVISDHGSDSHGQLQRDPATLEPVAIWERLSVLAAVRVPADCEDPIPDDLALVNLMPLVTNCLFGTDIPMQKPRFFMAPNTGTVAPMFEVLDPDQVYSGGSN
jgi:hypothetical protein